MSQQIGINAIGATTSIGNLINQFLTHTHLYVDEISKGAQEFNQRTLSLVLGGLKMAKAPYKLGKSFQKEQWRD